MDAFIEVLLDRLLATSVQTALLTAVVWALCRYLPRLSPATQCWLWWLVALQALIGLFASPLELPWLPQAPAAVSQLAAAAQGIALPVDNIALVPYAAEYARPWWPDIALALWMAGLAAMAWITAERWRHGYRLLQHSVPCSDTRLLQLLARATEAGQPVRTPQLRFSADIRSPVLIGQLWPVLLLPAATSLDSEELEMAVAHEMAHLRRGDLWWGWVPLLARLFFFFHPLVYVAMREYGIAREAACDAAVVEAEHRSRRDYGRLLLRLGTAANPGGGLAATSPTFNALKRRLTMLQHTSFLSRAGSLALLAVVAIAVLPLRLVAATATSTPATAAEATQTQPSRSAAPRTVTPAATPAAVVAPAAAQPPARSEAEADAARTSQTQAFIENQLRENQRRFAETEASLRQFRETHAGDEPDAAAREEIASLERRSTQLQRTLEELNKRTATYKTMAGAYQAPRSQPFGTSNEWAQQLLRSQVTMAEQRRALQPATRPRYQALFTQYETECQAGAEQWSRQGAQGALEKATCLERAEQRAYREALTAEQAAEKEAMVEQRRRAAMGLPPVEADSQQEHP